MTAMTYLTHKNRAAKMKVSIMVNLSLTLQLKLFSGVVALMFIILLHKPHRGASQTLSGISSSSLAKN